MIHFKRGQTGSWRNQRNPLADGQPGYDKTKNKLKIGDGEHLWPELPYVSGLSAKEILDTEYNAKNRYNKDSEDTTLITYGDNAPDNNTVGDIYLQYFDSEPETDYIVEYGVDGIWTYQKMHSGIARCWGTLPLTAEIKTAFIAVALYHDDKIMQSIKYPFTFIKTPTETATLQSLSSVVWLAGRAKSTEETSGAYTLISVDELESATYNISLRVEGFWK